jgi:hypothetical protein
VEGLGKFKKSIDLIGLKTRDLSACSIVPQPTTLPRAPLKVAKTSDISRTFVLLFQNDLSTAQLIPRTVPNKGRL